MTWVSEPGDEPTFADAETPGNQEEAEAGCPVLLVTVYNPIEAQIIAAKLRSAGIQTYVRHEAASVVYGISVDGLGQQDIMVRPEDLKDAQAALDLTP